MARVMVYRFEVLNYLRKQNPRSSQMGTLKAIGDLHGAKPLMESGIEIDEAEFDPDFPGMTRT